MCARSPSGMRRSVLLAQRAGRGHSPDRGAAVGLARRIGLEARARCARDTFADRGESNCGTVNQYACRTRGGRDAWCNRVGHRGAGARRQICRPSAAVSAGSDLHRQGLDLGRSTLADWSGAAFLLRPVHEWLLARLKQSPKLLQTRPPRCSIPDAAAPRPASSGPMPATTGPGAARTRRRLCLRSQSKGQTAERPPRGFCRHPLGRRLCRLSGPGRAR
ncbi:hypothetical protein M2427_005763 [Bradyrhizobium sp. BR13661]|nr:hypothetical protein [Bradyrhizobium sp. BR13661]